MWFDDEDMSGGRLRSSRGGGTGIVRLRTRMTERKKINVYRAGSLLLIPAVAVVAVLVGWYLIKLGGMLVFTGNDRFAITSLRIDPRAVVVQDFVRGKKGINEGINIFSFDLARLREDFLAGAPNYRSMEITRDLPGTLAIEAVERRPLARIGARGVLVVDRECAVFRNPGVKRPLPVIAGYDSPLEPGARMDGRGVAAVQILDVCDDPRLELTISDIDVHDQERLLVNARFEGQNKAVYITWDGMDQSTPESRMALLKKLGRWVRALQTDEGRRKVIFDATFGDRIYAL